ncbi:hypothetical protein KI688_009390 [Linnemannia hyalina]|uniref:DUF3020 domain-containing protein n=1 Tax=Linnemannia hyalina TaxID=64524 RepID=A0A9P8BVQ1_9FUNG|nr:hypothetical protein KI688_009390 [Linnemannia hyalina]
MLHSSPSKNGVSPYTAQQQQHSEADMDTSISNSTAASPSRLSSSNSSATSATTSNAYSYSQSYNSQLHRQQSLNNNSNNSTGTNASGYLSPLSIQHSNVPQIRSPLAMGFSAHSGSSNNGSIAAAATTLSSRINYNGNNTANTNNTTSTGRARDRRDSFQSPVAFSPTLSHSSPGVGGLTFQGGANSIYAHPPRFAHLWSGTSNTDGSCNSTSNRNRCLSTSSVDSNASSVGLSHLTPALAAMSVHHQASPANSPYQSYSSSPHHGGFQHQYQQQSTSTSPYPSYHTALSSSLQQTQVSAYDSLSVTASNIASNIYGSTPPLHSSSDMMYNSSTQYGAQMSGAASTAQAYNSTQRYGSAMLPLGPSLYSDQESSRTTQPSQPFDSASPLAAATRTGGAGRTTTFDYNDQQQYDPSSHGQYYGQSQQGLGIMVTGGMARSSSPDHTGLDDGDLQSSSSDMMGGLGSAKLGMKRNNTVGNALQTPDDIHAVLGKDGKTLVYLCPKCDPSKEFTTKSNLKRHLENKNIHNTPYERRRDQKRWQGHEKKQVSRDETTLRMRKWRSSNPEKNRFNDMRCRVYKLARIRYGEQYSASKEEFIASEIERRKQLMIIRNSRRVDWASQASGGEGSESSSTSPVPASTTAASTGFSIPSSDFTFGYETAEQMVTSHQQQQIPAYGSNNTSDSMTQDSSSNSKEEKAAPKDAQFLQDLIQNKLPPRRRSRSAMHSQMNNGASDAEAAIAAANALAFPASSQGTHAYGGHNDSNGFMSSSPPFGYSTTSPASPRQVRRLRKQRSTTENPDHSQYRHNQFSLGGAFGGYPSVLGGSSYDGSYMDSNEQLQMLEQKYSYGSISQTLGMATKSANAGGKSQETSSLEAVVEGMEIAQPLGPLDSSTTTNNATTASSGNTTGTGLYSDRDTSAWFAAATTTTYNAETSAEAEDGARGFPFPTIRDRKELARAAGIRLDIPSQQALGGSGWINGLNNANNNGGPGSDDRVGGSATSPESAAARGYHDFASPLSGGYGVHSSSQSPMLAPALTSTKHTKGSNMEVFSLQTGPMHLYGQGLGAPESSFFTNGTDANSLPSAAANYMAKEQPVGRRHSTHLSNLSM